MEKYIRKSKSKNIDWNKNPTKNVRGLYEIKGNGIDAKVNIVFFEKYDDELYSLYPLEKNRDLFKEILVKSSALNSLDKGISVKGETNNGIKVSVKRLGSQDFSFAKGGGFGLIGNQSKIDMNKNKKLDAEDFKLLRSSMNGSWRNEHKHVNHNQDHEVRYARKHNGRSGYKDKRNFSDSGSINYLSDLWFAVQQKDTDDYKMLSKNLDRLNVPFSIQNEVSADAETQRGRKSLNIPEVHERIKKILEKNENKFAKGQVIKFSEKSKAIAKKFEGEPVAPKYQRMYGKRYDKAEAKEVGNKIVGKMVSNGMDKKAFGGLFGKSSIMSNPKVSLDEKQVMLKNGNWVQVLDHSGDTLMVMDLSKLGSGVAPQRINISEVDSSSYMAGGKVKAKPTSKKTSGPTKRGGAMQLAKEIRKDGEKWTDAVKRASAQLKK